MKNLPEEPNEADLEKEAQDTLRRVKSFWTRLAMLVVGVVAALVYLAFVAHGVTGVIAVTVVLALALIALRYGIMPRF